MSKVNLLVWSIPACLSPPQSLAAGFVWKNFRNRNCIERVWIKLTINARNSFKYFVFQSLATVHWKFFFLWKTGTEIVSNELIWIKSTNAHNSSKHFAFPLLNHRPQFTKSFYMMFIIIIFYFLMKNNDHDGEKLYRTSWFESNRPMNTTIPRMFTCERPWTVRK